MTLAFSSEFILLLCDGFVSVVWRVVYLLILASWCYLYFRSGEVGGSLYPDLMGLQYVDPDPAFHDPDPDPHTCQFC